MRDRSAGPALQVAHTADKDIRIARRGTLTYRATVAQWHRDRRAARPKQAKMVGNPRLRRYVQERLAGRLITEDGVTVAGPDRSP